MKVKAKQDGFYGGSRRRAGTVFEFTGAKPGKWMEPLEEPAKPVKANKGGVAASPKSPEPVKSEDVI